MLADSAAGVPPPTIVTPTTKPTTLTPTTLTPPPSDQVIDLLAARQHGIVARFQLLEAGVSRYTLDHRVRRGRLVVIHRGVYRVGPIAGPFAREMAAVLACGSSAVVSHRSAGRLHGALPASSGNGPVDVSAPRSVRGRAHGVRLHRVEAFAPDDLVVLDGLPLTSPARTLFDLAGVLGADDLERAVSKIERAGGPGVEALRELMSRYPGRRGTRTLRTLLEGADPAFTRSAAEARFLAIMRKADVVAPRVNVIVEGLEVDFLWTEERLVVEIDGYEFHRGRAAFERDHRRDAILVAAGYRVMRVTWSMLTREPLKLVADVARSLATGR